MRFFFIFFLFVASSQLLAQVPSNDECLGAIVLPVNTNNTCTNIYSGNMGDATQSSPSCVASGYDAKDVWFKFTATAASHRITVTPVSNNDYVFQVYSGSCANLTSLGCINTGGDTEPDNTIINNLIIGNTYYMRVYNYYGATSLYETFNICINTAASLIDNDECAGAFNIIPDMGCSTYYSNTGATQSMPGCFGTAKDDIWFKFAATSTRHRITIGTDDDINPVLEIFSGNCSSLVSMACRYNNNGGSYSFIDADITTFIPGQTYYYRVYGTNPNNIGTNIGTCLTSLPPVVPIEISFFKAEGQKDNILLSWQTLTESNNLGFEVQYSKDGINFNTLTFVNSTAPNGYSNLPLNYSYEYNYILTGSEKIYYRLKQMDKNGGYKYSYIIPINTQTANDVVFLYPNPVLEKIYLGTNRNNNLNYIVLDNLGRIIKKGVVQNNSIAVSELRPGNYILRLFNKDGDKVFKFLKK